MVDEVACEVQDRGEWKPIDLALALRMPNTRLKRCPECHGRVRAHSAGMNGMRAHMEHHSRHKGCARGDCFGGVSTLHPDALT
jgi:nitrate/TMAO reductase-like tetraheme cytochrome c subunit